MKSYLNQQARRAAVVLCLSIWLPSSAAQFVELTAEIELSDWGYWFFADGHDLQSGPNRPRDSIFHEPKRIRCVVGLNTWLIEGDFSRNAKVTYWYTGTNIVTETLITKQITNEATGAHLGAIRLAMMPPTVGERFTRVVESPDGNPGQPVRVLDPLTTQAKVCWLAFCSGPFLKRDGRQIYPLSDLWKQNISSPSGFPDISTAFEDSLGLPRSMMLFAQGNRTVFQYQVHQSTNVLAWNFPSEFYMVTYGPASGLACTNGWQLQLTAKGKITSIGVGTEPWIPTVR